MSRRQRDDRAIGLINCESCPETFVTRGKYNRHLKTHTKPHLCDHCPSGFALRSDLDRHKAKHGGRVDARFYCKWSKCHDKGFSRKDNLLKHMRIVHGETIGTEQQDAQVEVQKIYKMSLKEQKTTTERLCFMKAVQIGNTSMVMLLLQNGANVAERNDTGQTSLHIAALNENLEMIQVLLDKGIDVEAKDDKNMSALDYAATTGNETISRILVQHGAGTSITERLKNGSTLLHDTCGSGSEGIVRLLLDRLAQLNANVDTLDCEQKTALYRAATNGHCSIVVALLAAGANSTGRPKSTSIGTQGLYKSALRKALEEGHEAVADVLAAASEKPTGRDLLSAIAKGYEAVVEQLISAGAHINFASSTRWGTTALHLAVSFGREAIVEKLIAAGGDVNHVPIQGLRRNTSLQEATAKGMVGIVEKLIAAGANVDDAPVRIYTRDYTPLAVAAKYGHLAILEKLIAAGADVNFSPSDCNGETALQLAKEAGHIAIVKKLVAAGAK